MGIGVDEMQLIKYFLLQFIFSPLLEMKNKDSQNPLQSSFLTFKKASNTLGTSI